MKDRRHDSLSFHVHPWKGFEIEPGLLLARATAGFFSISTGDIDTIFRLNGAAKKMSALQEKLNALKDQLEKLAGRK